MPPEPIVGYITKGRGITVHRRDCRNALRLESEAGGRMVEVSWGDTAAQTYPVTIRVEAYDRPGLLRDITQVLTASRSNVLSLNTLSNIDENTATMLVTVEIRSLEQLARLLAQIRNLPNIIEVRRKRS